MENRHHLIHDFRISAFEPEDEGQGQNPKNGLWIWRLTIPLQIFSPLRPAVLVDVLRTNYFTFWTFDLEVKGQVQQLTCILEQFASKLHNQNFRTLRCKMPFLSGKNLVEKKKPISD